MAAVPLAVVGHGKDFAALSRDAALSWVGERLVPTPFGSAVVHDGNYRGVPFVFGPRYAASPDSGQRVSPQALMFALATCGISRVLSLNGVGALTDDVSVNDFVIVDDFVDLAFHAGASYFDRAPGPICVRLNPAFCPELREALSCSTVPGGVRLRSGGTYVSIRGPRYETAAEAQLLMKLEGDVVGMRVSTEAALCRELEICYASLCFVLDRPEGSFPTPDSTSIEALKVGFDQELVNSTITTVVTQMIDRAKTLPRKCQCTNALSDARRRGLISGRAVNAIRALFTSTDRTAR
jgi:5'-methylthioadenosine phosphorylase